MKKKTLAVLCSLLLCFVMAVFSMTAFAQEAVSDPVAAEVTSAATVPTTASVDATAATTTEPVVDVATEVYDLERDGLDSLADGDYSYEDYYEDFYGYGSYDYGMYEYDYDSNVPKRSGLGFGGVILSFVIGTVAAVIFMLVTKNNYKHAGAGTVYNVTANTKLNLSVRRDAQIDERVSIDRGYYSR